MWCAKTRRASFWLVRAADGALLGLVDDTIAIHRATTKRSCDKLDAVVALCALQMVGVMDRATSWFEVTALSDYRELPSSGVLNIIFTPVGQRNALA